MNKSKHSINNRLSKKIDKEVRKAQKGSTPPEVLADSEQLTAQEMLKRFPHKVTKADKSRAAALASMRKNFQAKQKKHKKVSNRLFNLIKKAWSFWIEWPGSSP